MLNSKLTSLVSTHKIVKVMELSSIGKLKKMNNQAEYAQRYYAAIFESMTQLKHLLRSYEENKTGKAVIVLISSSQGFCGGYNAEVFRQVDSLKKTIPLDQEVSYIVIGNKGVQYLQKDNVQEVKYYEESLEELNYSFSRKFVDNFFEEVISGEIHSLHVVYTHYESPTAYQAKAQKLFPVSQELFNVKEKINLEFLEYEEKDKDVIPMLLHNYLVSAFYSCFILSVASELTQRRITMHAARKNLEDEIEERKIFEKKMRREHELNELIDIIGSSRVMRGETEIGK
ncbi:F0F1 ATP synthase subunit gamma [Listeria monocytogenes]|uniref:F0F1 ATP synthase subunit gamma n=1 Tax=Listeria monocytogenes TaxID=1639 RepID=UPI000873D9E3|nr:FoF1 ATP synthase subunit gamma [Listeria monocytogenes]EAE3710527.1 hypothetical protein [Listeria monocytogenes serotype 1/2b]EAC3180771.1 hypothetical protein [Listeria monocytogenes]EAC4040907.1 hypothetical protein [Listeria monocytogenes]EAC4503185.1 hypothetical protein [Listeria monocytogenes]EAC6741416.1 hypothetical protein [Listeria monocytogenes]